MIGRSLAERVTHRLVLPRRLPAPFSDVRIFVSSEGGLRYLKPRLINLDPTLLALTQEFVRPGAVVWDVGANVGLFSFSAAWAAGPAGRVVALEPDTWLVRLLGRSAQRAAGAPVDVVPIAVSDTDGVGLFHVARRSRATSHLHGFGTTQTGGARHLQYVPTLTLDTIARFFPAPDLLKVDVEGAELLVLNGARSLLAASRPVLICEVARENAEATARLLRDLDYEIYDAAASPRATTPIMLPGHVTLALPGKQRS